MNKVGIIVLVIIVIIGGADMEVTVSECRSPQHLIELAEMDAKIYNILNDYSKVLETRIQIVKGYLQDFKETSMKASAHLDGREAAVALSKNPIMSYRMIRRYSKMLRSLYTDMSTNEDSKILQEMAGQKSPAEMLSKWPSDGDLDHAMEALIQIHKVYDFNLDEFASGSIMGTRTNVELKSIHCQEIGEYAVDSEYFYSGVLWLETALKLAGNTSEPESLIQVQRSLKYATEAHDVGWSNQEDFYYDLFSERLNGTLGVKYRESLRDFHYKKDKEEQSEPDDTSAFWELCNGQNHQTEEEISKLFCLYDKTSNPAWVINPLKVEQLSLSPYIVQIYDILGENAIKALKEEAIPSLRRSGMGHSGKSVSNYRTSVHAWLNETSANANLFARRLEFITGLNLLPAGSAEWLQIASYAIGGHYGVHMDAVKSLYDNIYENRIATVMTYLEDVEIGGFTAFPRIGVVARPIKGSALIWFNLLKDGEIDENTHHGACPVVLGHKWIATKWILATAQLLNRPCGLSPGE